MLGIFSCVCCSSVCLLWINVYLRLLPIFLLRFFFVIFKLYKLFVNFGNWALICCIIYKHFLPVCSLSFHFVYDTLCCAKICLIRSHLFIFVFISIALDSGEGNGNPLQCSCLENPRDRGAWWAAVYGVTQSRTRLKQLSSSSPW